MSEPTITAAAAEGASVRLATSATTPRAVDGSSDDAASGADFIAVLVAALAGADPSAGALATGRSAPDGEVGAGPSDVEVTATGVATASEVALLALGRWAAATTVPGSTTPTVASTAAVDGADPASTTAAATPAVTPGAGTAPAGVPGAGLAGATSADAAALRGASAATTNATVTAAGTAPLAAPEDGAVTTAHLASGVVDVGPEVPTSGGSSTTAGATTTTTSTASNVAAAPERAPDPGGVAGRAIGRVLDALDVLENAPPPRRVTIDVGDTGGTRLQVALRGSEVHVSLVAGGGQSDLSGWARDLSTALEARGFSLGGDAGEGQRRDRPGADPDDPMVPQPDGRAEDASRSVADPSDPTTASGHDGALRL